MLKIGLFFLSPKEPKAGTFVKLPGLDHYVRFQVVTTDLPDGAEEAESKALMEALDLAVVRMEPGEYIMNVHFVKEEEAKS
jgi:hypothetical protein